MVKNQSDKQQRSTPASDGASSSNVRQAGDQVRKSAENVAESAAEQLAATADRQKDALADRAEDVVQVVRKSAQDLSEQESWLGGYADSAADRMEKALQSIRERDAKALIGDLEAFGRRHPGLFLGASVAIGFGLARFARSTQSRSHNTPDYGSDRGPSGRNMNQPHSPSATGTAPYSDKGNVGAAQTGPESERISP